MITELGVKNFQIHKDLTIRFTKGLNVVIGDTGIGKSSLVRALYLAIMNQPRSGENIYQNRNTKDPLEIKIKDDKNNIIKRTQRKYYLNHKLMKAVGTAIPLPIAEVLPFKDVNWQKQLDQHFLILNTGGAAAKILNASSGMEDQESLLKEVKAQISEHKSNINRLIKNNHEHDITINRLRYVTRFLLIAKAIKNIQDESDLFNKKINQLDLLLNEIFDCRIDPTIFNRINYALNEIAEIEKLNIKNNEFISNINILKSICDQINEAKYFSKKVDNYNKLYHSIISLHAELIEHEKMETQINSLSSLIENITMLQKDIINSEEQINITRTNFDNKLIELGECPLCGTIFNKRSKGGHKC